jgi:hypothetical protein
VAEPFSFSDGPFLIVRIDGEAILHSRRHLRTLVALRTCPSQLVLKNANILQKVLVGGIYSIYSIYSRLQIE